MSKTRFECRHVISKNWAQMTPGSETLTCVNIFFFYQELNVKVRVNKNVFLECYADGIWDGYKANIYFCFINIDVCSFTIFLNKFAIISYLILLSKYTSKESIKFRQIEYVYLYKSQIYQNWYSFKIKA